MIAKYNPQEIERKWQQRWAGPAFLVPVASGTKILDTPGGISSVIMCNSVFLSLSISEAYHGVSPLREYESPVC